MILRIILVALRNLLRQPFRTFLILQGVIWGTALGVFPPAVINGSRALVEGQASRLGTDRLLLTQEQVGAGRLFDWSMAARLRQEYTGEIRHATCIAVIGPPTIPLFLPGIDRSVCPSPLVILHQIPQPPVIATDEQSLTACRLKLARGRFFTADEVGEGKRVCVLEHQFAVGLKLDDHPAMNLRLADGRELEIIGVTAPRSTAGEALDELGYHKTHPMRALLDELKQYVGVFNDPELSELTEDRAVIAPYTLFPGVRPRWVELRAEPKDVLRLRDSLQSNLSAAGYEPMSYANAILPILYGETIKTAIELNRAVFVLCICVGTAVVCAIMVLSVVERQREIAIRRVEGARRWHIALQFVVETGTICTVGAVAGVPLGIVLAIIRCALEPLGSVTWTFPPAEVSVLVATVTAIGLLGGLLPAWRAMRVDPVEMLRYE